MEQTSSAAGGDALEETGRPTSRRDAVAIMGLAASLELHSIAEGVQTPGPARAGLPPRPGSRPIPATELSPEEPHRGSKTTTGVSAVREAA